MDGCSQYRDYRLRSEGNLPARQGHKVNCPKGKRESPGGYPYRATLRHVIPSGTCEFRCFAQFILADAVYSHQASELRNTVMLRLRRAADMCSSTVLTLRICGHIARKARPCGRKNPLPFPCFAAIAVLRFSPCSPKGNGSQEGRNPLALSAWVRRPQRTAKCFGTETLLVLTSSGPERKI